MCETAASGMRDEAGKKSDTALDLDAYKAVSGDRAIMELLLADRSTGRNIVWATDSHSGAGKGYGPADCMDYLFLLNQNKVIRPRIFKTDDEQKDRIVDHAEVFTPPWIVNEQNNLVDEQWIGVKDPFNVVTGKNWTPVDRIDFGTKSWKEYVKSVRLEVCCGEAPYITTRYDAVKGTEIPVRCRVGLLDRKLRTVSENTDTEEEWLGWANWAIKSTYGYEMQGDSLLLARENVLLTFIEHYKGKFRLEPDRESLLRVAEIISWNIWQMDGIECSPPFPPKGTGAARTWDSIGTKTVSKRKKVYCWIKDWNRSTTEKFLINEKKTPSRKVCENKNSLDAW